MDYGDPFDDYTHKETMPYIAKVEGKYRSRLYINLLLFKIASGWKEQKFSWSQQVLVPELHTSYTIKSVPITVALDYQGNRAGITLQIVGMDVATKYFALPAGMSEPFHFEPWKGIVIEGTASFQAV